MNYKLHNGQLTPKDGKRWLEMVAYHKQANKSFPEIPAEQWYYFYIMGLMQGKIEVFDNLEKSCNEPYGLKVGSQAYKDIKNKSLKIDQYSPILIDSKAWKSKEVEAQKKAVEKYFDNMKRKRHLVFVTPFGVSIKKTRYREQ